MLKKIGRFIRGYFIAVGVIITALFLWILLILPTRQIKPVTLPSDAKIILKMELQGDFLQKGSEKNLWQKALQDYLGRKLGPYIPDMRFTISKARTDQRVKALFIKVDNLTGGLSDFTELQKMLIDFKESGKPIHFWTNDLDSKVFLLASAADHITIPPLANIMIPGPNFRMAYFGEALKKIGVDVEVLRAGTFKSFGEPFIQNMLSQETKEMFESLDTSWRDALIESISQAREIDKTKVAGWFQTSFFLPEQAAQAGLIDSVAYQTEAENLLKDQVEGEFYPLSKYEQVLSSEAENLSSSGKEEGIALIEAVGEIRLDLNEHDPNMITPVRLIKELEWAGQENKVRSVLLRINSPGGSALAADLIWQKVEELASKKPVIVSIAGVAASGGYYIAAPATRILSEKTALTGSIGVVGLFPNLNQFDEKYGVSFHIITKSERRSLLNPGEKLSESDRTLLQTAINDVYDKFISRVAKGRKMEVAAIDKVGQGRVWTGAQAIELGLVDQIGGFDESIKSAKELAGLDPQKTYPLYRWQPPITSFAECLVNARSITDCLNTDSSLMNIPRDTMSYVHNWLKTIAKEPIQAIWPYHLLMRE